MTDHLLRRGRGWRRATQVTAALLAVASAGTVGGCLARPLEQNEPRTTSTIVEPFTQSAVDKIDLLLMIDNSRSMADKQAILADAVPDLVKGLVNPNCLDPNSGVPAAQQPTSPLEACPAGTKREFEPVLNIHIGIISSSLGGHGSDACLPADSVCPGGTNPSNNDAGHLLSRKDSCTTDAALNVATYDASQGNTGKGFLAWDPSMQLTPVGETKIDEIVPKLRDMVVGVGQVGCGYEAQHESWYRFLIEPDPYLTIPVQDGKAVPTGVDQALLQQRADFLRPSSLLAIIMLTDENDCSIKESGTNFLAAQQHVPGDKTGKIFHLPRPRQECATNPDDPCCKSCGSDKKECPDDPTCAQSLSDTEDDINLRCFDQKRRFGFDFLYPTSRYTDALTKPVVLNRAGEVVPNPIFSDLNPNDNDTNIRDVGLVFLAGIVGVPWQLIARDPADLTKGFKSAEELNQKDATSGNSTWDQIVGDPTKYVPPKDAHMVESIKARAGLPTAADAAAGTVDPLNGHEYSVPKNDDLQYACVFDLPTPRDCSQSGIVSCDCGDKLNDNPLCNPANPQQQIKAKGYPGLRELALLHAVGAQGIVASVCPAQIKDPTKADYGYRPAIGSIIDRLKTALGGKCLPRELNPNPKTHQVPCLIIEAKNVGKEACECPLDKARQKIQTNHEGAVDAAKAYPIYETAQWNCFCEIIQVGDPVVYTDRDEANKAELDACQNNADTAPVIKDGPTAGQNVNGWCYVDATTVPATGNPLIVKDCPDTEKRLVRFVGAGNPVGSATLFITCSGE